jgi:hypothetical protein
MNGIPYIKYQCLVLCLKSKIPVYSPGHPPINANQKKVLSGIRHTLLLALYLSIPTKVKARTFIIINIYTIAVNNKTHLR